jgi:CRISPR-associated exonuclease Cas4
VGYRWSQSSYYYRESLAIKMVEHNKDRVYITPTEIKTFFYCPRLLFFELYLGRKITLRRRIRAALGSLYHTIKHLLNTIRGIEAEKNVTLELGKYTIKGRIDALEEDDDKILIHEYKSGSGPRAGAWLSDYMQALTYAFISLRNTSNSKTVIFKLHYRSKTLEFNVDSEPVNLLLKAMSDIYIIKKYGVLPDPNPSPRKCSICPYKDICHSLQPDEALSSWVKSLGSIVRSSGIGED